jgi:hypothetical protein
MSRADLTMAIVAAALSGTLVDETRLTPEEIAEKRRKWEAAAQAHRRWEEETMAQWKAEQDAIAAPYREARRLRNIAKMQRVVVR